MATKTLNTKILLRIDTLEAWNTANPVLLKGEMGIATVPATTEPVAPASVLIKVGDGTAAFADLPYISALAADVIEACKTEAGLKTFINTVIADAGIATDEALKTVSDAVDKLNGADTVEGSVAHSIKTAIEGLDVTDAAVEHQFVTVVSETDGVISVTRAQPVIADVDGLQTALDAKQDNLVFMTAYDKDTNKVATATDLQKVADDASAEIANKISTTYKAAGSVATVDAIPAASKDTLGYVYNLTAAGTTTDAFVEGAGKAIPEGANIVVVEIPGENEGDPATYKFDVLSGMVDLSDYAKTTEVATAITNAIQALDVVDTAEDGKVVSSVSETDGLITVVRRALVTADIPELTSDKITDITTKIQTVLKESLAKPTIADPDNPTADETAAQELYNQILTEVTNIVNEALTGNDTTSQTIINTVETVIKDAILDAGDPDADPAVPASEINTAINGLIDAKIADLDSEVAVETDKYIQGFKVVDGKVTNVTKGEINLNVNNLTQTEGDSLIINGGNAQG